MVIKPKVATNGINIEIIKKGSVFSQLGKKLTKISNRKSTVIYLFHPEQYQDYQVLPERQKATNQQLFHQLRITL